MNHQSLFVFVFLAIFLHMSYSFRPQTIRKIGAMSQRNRLYEDKGPEDINEATKKYGLEVGLWKSFTNKNANVKPQDLLKKYGIAYLATSISFAIVSYAICYLLVSYGVDVGALLEKIGMKANAAASNAGTAGIAYAIHKAASPIRFPPTVALTPIVAEWIGKKPVESSQDSNNKTE